MQLTVFQSGKGDCLLLADTGDKTRILVDGGMPDAYSEHVAPALSALRKKKKKDIDLVYVSHIDQDHIGGILRMLDDEVLWRVHEHQVKSGNRTHPVPSVPRPPKIGGLWHNAFANNCRSRRSRSLKPSPLWRRSCLAPYRRATGHRPHAGRAGFQRRGSDACVTPYWRHATQDPAEPAGAGQPLMRRKGQKPIKLGLFQITVLAPGAKQLEALRAQWAAWLEKASSKKLLNQLREKSRADEKALGAADFEQLFAMIRLQAEAFGDPASVTPRTLRHSCCSSKKLASPFSSLETAAGITSSKDSRNGPPRSQWPVQRGYSESPASRFEEQRRGHRPARSRDRHSLRLLWRRSSRQPGRGSD